MSSCFLCDTSYKLTSSDMYSIVYAEGKEEYHDMKYMPIMTGSSGLVIDSRYHTIDGNDQQHKNNNQQNYVSYRVKKIEFRASVNYYLNHQTSFVRFIPDYIIIFKVPFREPIFDYYFTIMKNFILYSEPESVLKYGVYALPFSPDPQDFRRIYQINPDKYNLTVDKPFIVGPNDYVGVLYMFSENVYIESSAKVWFDIA